MESNNRNNWISDFIQKYSIVDVIQHYLKLIKKGNDYKAICPFHADSNPSLSISVSRNIFKCFTCNTAGNAVQFIMLYKKIPFGEAIKEFKTILNIDDTKLDRYISSISKVNEEELEIFNVNKRAAFFYHNTLFENENIESLNYLRNRLVDDETIKFYEIGYAPKKPTTYLLNLFQSTKNSHNIDSYKLLKSGLVSLTEKNDFIDFFHDRLLIPIKNEQGYIAGFSGRTINPEEKVKYINTKTTIVFQKENILFNFFAFDKSQYEEVFVVEGYMDVFALRRLGIENAVASMGTSFTTNQINLIKKYQNIKRLILCFDNDKAGNSATIALVEKLVKNNFDVFIVKPFDPKYKDIDELTRSLSKEECLKLINNQIGFIEYQIDFLKRLDLSYKDKKVALSNIIEMLNKFAYNEKFFTEDKRLISNFFDIDVTEVESLIKSRNYKNKFNIRTSKSNDVFDNFKSEIINELENSSFNKINVNQDLIKSNNDYIIKSKNYKQLKNQEIWLIINLIFSKRLSNLYFKYLGFLLFNSQDQQMLSRVLKVIIQTLRDLENTEYTPRDVIYKIIVSNKLDDNQKKFFESLITQHLKINYFIDILTLDDFSKVNLELIEPKIFSQGIELLSKIKLYHFSVIVFEKRDLIVKCKARNNLEHIGKIEKEIKIVEKEKDFFNDEINRLILSLS